MSHWWLETHSPSTPSTVSYWFPWSHQTESASSVDENVSHSASHGGPSPFNVYDSVRDGHNLHYHAHVCNAWGPPPKLVVCPHGLVDKDSFVCAPCKSISYARSSCGIYKYWMSDHNLTPYGSFVMPSVIAIKPCVGWSSYHVVCHLGILREDGLSCG